MSDRSPREYRTLRTIAVLYATRVAATLRTRGFAVKIRDLAVALPPDFDLNRCAGAVLAASIHMGKHEKELVAFVKRHRAELERMPCTLLSVSLSQASVEDPATPPGRRQRTTAYVRRTIEKLLRKTRWKPTQVHAVAGALLYRQYRMPVRLMVRFIAGVVGVNTETTRDHEYTDWQALDRYADEFAAAVKALRSATDTSPLQAA